MDIPYPVASDVPELGLLIDQKVELLAKKYFTPGSPSESALGLLLVVFYHQNPTKAKRKSSWFGHKDTNTPENVPFERWILHIECKLPANESDRTPGPIRPPDVSKQSFEENMIAIYDHVDTEKDHIPPITTLDVSPFAYEIEVGTTDHRLRSSDDETWGNYIKKMLD